MCAVNVDSSVNGAGAAVGLWEKTSSVRSVFHTICKRNTVDQGPERES